jgi:putative polyhydroxyalkanoate system protein
MADISIRREHSLGVDTVKTVAKKVVDGVRNEYPSLVKDISWNGDETVAKVKGKGFTGTFSFKASEVVIDIDLSFFARPMKGKVEGIIKERLEEHFSN